METFTLADHLVHQRDQGVFDKVVTIVVADDEDHSAEAGKDGKKVIKKAIKKSYKIAKNRALLVITTTNGPVHLQGGDMISIHRTSKGHPVGVTIFRASLPQGTFGRQIDTSCRDIKNLLPG